MFMQTLFYPFQFKEYEQDHICLCLSVALFVMITMLTCWYKLVTHSIQLVGGYDIIQYTQVLSPGRLASESWQHLKKSDLEKT
jgi:hypothetical protein